LFIFLGFFSRKIGLFRKEDVSVLKNVIIYLTLPALVFVVVYRSSFSLSFFKIPALAWGVMFLSLGVALLLTRTLSLKRETSGAFILTSAIGNTGYFGYPLALAFYGNAGFVRSLFYDLFGTVPFVFTIGVYLAENFGKGNKSVNPLRNVFTFPPFLALIAAYLLQFLVGQTGTALPSFILGALDSLGKVTIPLIVISIGLSLELTSIRVFWFPIFLVCLVKLVLSPLFGYLIGSLFLKSTAFKVSVLEASMPTFMLSLIIGSRSRLDTSFISGAILVTTLVSIVTIPFWQFLFNFVK